MRRFAVVALTLTLCLAPGASMALAAEKPIEIRFSHVAAENTPKGWAAKEFARRANEELKGKVQVVVFPNAGLYVDNQAIEALSAGFIEMAAPSIAKYAVSVPQLQLFDMPFLFPSAEATYKVIDGPIGREIFGLFNKRGLKALALWDNGFKKFTSNIRPLLMPEDFKGRKFRIVSSDILEAQMKLLGATGLKLPFTEVYNALEQGVVDGQENTASNIYSKKIHEVQKYMTISDHGYIGYIVVTREKFWNGLPEDVRTTLERIIKEITAEERVKARELNEGDMKKMRDYAMASGKLEIIEMNAEQRAAFQKALESVHKMLPDVVPLKWIEEIYQMKKTETAQVNYSPGRRERRTQWKSCHQWYQVLRRSSFGEYFTPPICPYMPGRPLTMP